MSSLTIQPKRYVLNSGELHCRPSDRVSVAAPTDSSIGFEKNASKLFFFRSLATMLNAGVPLSRGLNLLTETDEGDNLRTIAAGVSATVEQGYPLSTGMRRFPKAFDRFQLNLVRAGEESGGLVEVLRQLAVYEERRRNTEQIVKKALVYPAAILVVGFLLFLGCGQLFGDVKGLFAGLGLEAPFSWRLCSLTLLAGPPPPPSGRY